MTHYLIWCWGLKGPLIGVKMDDKELNEFERSTALTALIPLKEGEEKLTLDELAKLYPPPINQEYPDKVMKTPRKKDD